MRTNGTTLKAGCRIVYVTKLSGHITVIYYYLIWVNGRKSFFSFNVQNFLAAPWNFQDLTAWTRYFVAENVLDESYLRVVKTERWQSVEELLALIFQKAITSLIFVIMFVFLSMSIVHDSFYCGYCSCQVGLTGIVLDKDPQ